MISELKTINALYGLNFEDIVHLHTGENKSYLLKSQGKLFVLKVYRSNRTQRINVQDEIHLSKTLGDFGINHIEYCASINGNYVEELMGTQVTLFRFSEGWMLFSPEEDDYFQLGKELRKLHDIPWKEPRLPTHNFPSVVNQNWEHVLNASFLSSQQKREMTFYKDLVEEQFNFKGEVCVHFDLHWGNVILNQQNRMLFLDWEECGKGNPVLDIGTINAHLMKRENRVHLLQALLAGHGTNFSVDEINLATIVKLLNLAGHIPTKLDMPQLKNPTSIFERYLSYFKILAK